MKLLIAVFLISSCIFSIAAQTSGKCDPQDSLFGNKCYRFVNQLMNFTSAVNYCRGIGYSLTSIHSIAENNFLRLQSENIFDKTYHNFHIGLYSPSKNTNNWVFVDGSAYDFMNWHSGEPTGTHWYVAFRISSGKWITVSNSASIPFVCSAASNNTSPANTTVVPMTTMSSGTCTAQICGNFTHSCAPGTDCTCYETNTGGTVCAADFTCPDYPDCTICPSSTSVCIINTCCGSPVCIPTALNAHCTASLSHNLFNPYKSKLPKRQACKEDRNCLTGKSCKLFSSGRFCA